MDDYVIWFGLGLVLVAAELATGTFYLLMVAIGFAAGGLAALGGLGTVTQLVIAAIVGAAATLAMRQLRTGQREESPDAARNPNLNIDIGQTVDVTAWHKGRARLQYRGASWDAELAGHASTPGAEAAPGSYRIAAIHGSTLVLTPLDQE